MTSNLAKAVLLASVGVLAFGNVPAQAAPVASGYVDAWAALGSSSNSYIDNYYYADGDLDYADRGHSHSDYNTLGGDGRGALQWDSGFGIQLDGSSSDTNYRHENSDQETTNLAAHFFQRSDDMLWGGFGSIGSSEGSRFATLGAEFQKYCNDWTFYGQVSWSKGTTGTASAENVDSWNFNAQARYFVSSHLLLTGGVGYSAGYNHAAGEDYVYHEHSNGWNWTLRAEYLLDDLPVSIFGEYDGSYVPFNEHETDAGEEYAYDIYKGHNTNNLFLVGVRLFLNQQDLTTNDRTGASLEDFNPWTGGRIGYGASY